jgi:accessory colonization factor AcfC
MKTWRERITKPDDVVYTSDMGYGDIRVSVRNIPDLGSYYQDRKESLDKMFGGTRDWFDAIAKNSDAIASLKEDAAADFLEIIHAALDMIDARALKYTRDVDDLLKKNI